MFAIVRTGGKQYRVAAGDKIAVEKLPGEAGDTVTLDDVLLAGDGGEIKDSKGLLVSAEIIAQERSEKVVVFKKRRRHNYRRKQGHRQSITLLRIMAVGDVKAPKKEAAKAAPAVEAKEEAVKAAPKKETAKKEAPKKAAEKAETKPAAKKAAPKKAAPKKAAEKAEAKPAAKKAAPKKAAPKKTDKDS